MKAVIKSIHNYCFLMVLVVFCSCKHSLGLEPYLKYVRDEKNGLNKTITIENWKYNFQYKPYDFIALMENQGKINRDNMEKRKEELKGTVWFNVSFRLNDGSISPLRYNISSKEAYDLRLNYFLNTAPHNFQLVYDNRDTLQQIGYLFENNYNLAPIETMIVGFALPEGIGIGIGIASPCKDLLLSYYDEEFKNGIIKINYKAKDLNNIPNLSY